MKNFIFTLCLLSGSMAHAGGNLTHYDEVTGEIIEFLADRARINTPDYDGKPGYLKDADITCLQVNPKYYCKVSGGLIVEKSQAEKDAYDQAVIVATTTATRDIAKSLVKNQKELKAIINRVVKEINILRQWDLALKAAVAACATCPAGFKSDVAALPTLNDRTLDQAIFALESDVNAGDVDQ